MDAMDRIEPESQKLYFDGTEVEVWENPDVHFGASPADLKGFFHEGSWVALFNAMTLASSPDLTTGDSLPTGRLA